MRKFKMIKIEGYEKEITVRELRVKEIKGMLQAVEDINNINDLGGILKEWFPVVTDLPVEALEEFAPSELDVIWRAVQEVNQSFFDLGEKIGIPDFLKKVIASVSADLQRLSTASLNRDILELGSIPTRSL